VRLPGESDTRLLLVGVAAFAALVVYLAVAFVNTHASVSIANKVAPWTPYGSKLTPIPLKRKGKYVVRVSPTDTGSYGALIPTLIPAPTPGIKYAIGLQLKGARAGRLGIQVHLFRGGLPSRYLTNTLVPITTKWHRLSFGGQIEGSWVGLSLYVYSPARRAVGSWFAIRDLKVKLRG